MANEVKKVRALRVTSRAEGFRRAGIAFGKAPVDLPIADLSKNQLKALKSEEMLTVTEVDIDAPAE